MIIYLSTHKAILKISYIIIFSYYFLSCNSVFLITFNDDEKESTWKPRK